MKRTNATKSKQWRTTQKPISSRTNITVKRLNLTKQRLANLAAPDRQLLLLLGHAANEINVLSKLILMCGQGRPTIQIVDYVEAGQVMILLRILIGKLHEAWELFRKRVLSNSDLSRKYLPLLDQEATTALGDLKKHFGRKSPLTRIRQKFSFHYEDEDNLIEAAFQRLSPDEVWELYFSKEVGNSFYYASELVVTFGILTLMNGNAADDANAQFARLYQLTVHISRQMTQVFHDMLGATLASIGPRPKMERITLIGVPRLEKVAIPYFVRFPRRRRPYRTRRT